MKKSWYAQRIKPRPVVAPKCVGAIHPCRISATGGRGFIGATSGRGFMVLVAMAWSCCVSMAAEPVETLLRIAQNGTTVSICGGDQPLLQYRYAGTLLKPYVEQLFSPGGVNVLRDSPADHKHHHGLMFAVAVDGVGFWEERDGCGSQKHRSLDDVKTFTRNGLSWAVFTQQLDWINPNAEKMLQEQRTIEVCRVKEPGASLLVWRTRLEPPPGKESATLTGSHYYGLGMRFVQSMDKVGRFFNADGKDGQIVKGSEQRLVRSRWCAYTAPADGKPVTVAIFDHPKNPRHPAVMFTMPERFAYLSATLNLWKEPLVLKAGQTLKLQYAVVLCDGRVEAARIEQLYQEWIML